MDINFSIEETEALVIFLKNYINKNNLSIYKEDVPKHLLLAFVKLINAKEEQLQKMAYTE